MEINLHTFALIIVPSSKCKKVDLEESSSVSLLMEASFDENLIVSGGSSSASASSNAFLCTALTVTSSLFPTNIEVEDIIQRLFLNGSKQKVCCFTKKKEIKGLFWFLFEGFTSIRPQPLICLEYFI
jgi:hypothetical protein